jgi:hypothetical protein
MEEPEIIDPFDDGVNRCNECGDQIAPQVNFICERCRERFFGSLEGLAAMADYWNHVSEHPDCDCP